MSVGDDKVRPFIRVMQHAIRVMKHATASCRSATTRCARAPRARMHVAVGRGRVCTCMCIQLSHACASQAIKLYEARGVGGGGEA